MTTDSADTIDTTRPFEAYVVTTITGCEPTLIPDRHNPSFVIFRYPNSPEVRAALEAYTMNNAVPVRDFERTFLRLRNAMYQYRGQGGRI